MKRLSLLFAFLWFVSGIAFGAPCEGKVVTTASKGAKVDCPHAAKAKDAKSAKKRCSDKCPVKGHEVVKLIKDATIQGTIVCLHCDLHKRENCQKVLQTADKKLYPFCPDSVSEVELSKFARKQVVIKGMVHELKDADPVIHVKSIEVAKDTKA